MPPRKQNRRVGRERSHLAEDAAHTLERFGTEEYLAAYLNPLGDEECGAKYFGAADVAMLLASLKEVGDA